LQLCPEFMKHLRTPNSTALTNRSPLFGDQICQRELAGQWWLHCRSLYDEGMTVSYHRPRLPIPVTSCSPFKAGHVVLFPAGPNPF